ncbi:MAG: aminotransferase class I/II-fold pyridoxal phosphate-dependent enzyme [Nitrospiraceae bacterium]|nr:aminotransferase class I/II-fold pyridoxal phosphate-dependent enzyme [Nitrospiraceae bacterium]
MKFVDLGRQYQIYKKEIDSAIQEVVDSSQFVLGKPLEELETALAGYVGTDYAIGVGSGTDGLLLALMAMHLEPGEEVITTPFTFIATAEVICLLKARPVFVDIDPESFNIDINRLEDTLAKRQKVGAKVRAILPVGLYGQCADMDEINEIAAKADLSVVEDACQSFGARYKDRMSCAVSDIGITSFFPSKPLGAYGDGGMVFTDNSETAEKIRCLRVHGQRARYRHEEIGINGRLDSIQAAIILAKFAHFEQELRARQEVAHRYTELIHQMVPEIQPPVTMPERTNVYAQYTVRIPGGLRDNVADFLKKEGIPTAIHYPIPIHMQPAFRYLDLKPGSFPEAEKAAKEVLSLPMYAFIRSEEQEIVVDGLRKAMRQAFIY